MPVQNWEHISWWELAGEWLRLLRTTLRQLGVSDVNMEEGSLRCDANISLRPVGTTALGTKTELKNMNSFRFIERGIRAEIARQEKILRAGERVMQETLHFDPSSGAITSLRSKAVSYTHLRQGGGWDAFSSGFEGGVAVAG